MPTPFTDLKDIQEILGYRKEVPPVSFRGISKKTKKPLKTVYRLYRKGIGKDKMRLKI